VLVIERRTEKHHFIKVTPFFDEIRDFTNSSWMSKWNIQATSIVFRRNFIKNTSISLQPGLTVLVVERSTRKISLHKGNSFFGGLALFWP
jgi:hypothetical protein